STYGKNMRDAIGANDFSTSRVMDYAINVSPDRIVTWVESHDNYANAIHEWGSSQWMNDEQIKLTWAAVAARKGGTPLFFSRPVGGGGQTWDNRFPNRSKIGDRGSDLFMDDEVAAVNKFRNAMVGQNEYLRNPNGNSKILMIERGTKGAVIINLNYSDTYISSTTNLANGSYDNKTDNNNVFTVTNSRITGTLPARSVVVLYNTEPDEPVEPSVMNIYFQKPSSWNSTVYAYVYDESGSTVQKNASWPGAPMSYDSATGYYKYSYLNSWSQPKVIFGDGTNQAPGANLTGYTVKNNTVYNTNGEAGTVTVTPSPSPSVQPSVQPSVSPSVTPPTTDKIYFSKPSDWGNTVYAYVYDESGSSVVTNASWPGIAMTRETNGEYSYVLNTNVTSTSKVIFNDGSKQTSKNGFAIVKNGHYDSNGIIGGTTANTITIYYKTNWSSTNIHYKIGNGSWTTVPGVKMSSSDRTGYQVITIDLGTATTLTACFNNGNGTWDSKYGNNYFFDSIGTYTVADGVITKQ
ncbi:MAG: starch-binding protein, partial [Clostridium sp.]|nr:starch-binding protein [Clostridium sp.]